MKDSVLTIVTSSAVRASQEILPEPKQCMLRVINGQSVGSRGEVDRGKAFRTSEGKEGQEAAGRREEENGGEKNIHSLFGEEKGSE